MSSSNSSRPSTSRPSTTRTESTVIISPAVDTTDDTVHLSRPPRDWNVQIFSDVDPTKRKDDKLNSSRSDDSRYSRNTLAVPRLSKKSDITPRSRYAISKSEDEAQVIGAILALDEQDLALIKHKFSVINNGNGVELEGFVELIACNSKLASFVQDSSKLISVLTAVFEMINLNGDEVITWPEFTQFLVESADSRVRAVGESVDRYASSEFWDATQHMNTVSAVKWFSSLNCFVVFEKASRTFRLYTRELRLKKVVNGHRGFLLDGVDLPHFSMFATSASDMTITFWSTKPDEYFVMLKQWDLAKPQIALAATGSVLFSANAFGKIISWNIGRGESKMVLENLSNDAVMKLLVVPDENVLFSASTDSTVIMWDALQGDRRMVLRGHETSVLHLAWWGRKRTLVSAGTDSYVLLWRPFEGISDPYSKIEIGFRSVAVVNISVAGNDLVVCDIDAIFWIFDLETLRCVQCFFGGNGFVNNMSPDGSDSHLLPTIKFKTSTRHRSSTTDYSTHEIIDFASCTTREGLTGPIIASNGVLTRFDRCSALLTQRTPVPFAEFNPLFLTLITMTNNKIFTWNVLTGICEQEFEVDLPGNAVTATLDNYYRRLFVGDDRGNLQVYNVQNGALIKKLDGHTKEVVSIGCARSLDLILTGSRDKTVIIHQDNNDIHHSKVSVKQDHHRELTVLTLGNEIDMFATGDAAGSICVYAIQTTGTSAAIYRGHETTISAILFLEPHQIFVSADQDGVLDLWYCTLRGVNSDFLMQWKNSENSLTDVIPAVRCMAWDAVRQVLWTGDERGTIRGWDMAHIVPEAQTPRAISAYGGILTWMRSVRTAAKPKPITEIHGHESEIYGLQLFSTLAPDEYDRIESNALMSWGFDGRVCIWDTITFERIGVLHDENQAQDWNLPVDIEYHEQKARDRSLAVQSRRNWKLPSSIELENVFYLTQGRYNPSTFQTIHKSLGNISLTNDEYQTLTRNQSRIFANSRNTSQASLATTNLHSTKHLRTSRSTASLPTGRYQKKSAQRSSTAGRSSQRMRRSATESSLVPRQSLFDREDDKAIALKLKRKSKENLSITLGDRSLELNPKVAKSLAKLDVILDAIEKESSESSFFSGESMSFD